MNGVTPQKGERDAILEVAKKSQLVSVLDVETGTVIITHKLISIKLAKRKWKKKDEGTRN
jgi:hypothetical protein